MSVNIIFKSFIFFWTISLSLCTILDGDLHPGWKHLPKESCGIGSLADRIVGGKEATLGQFPWMARIGYGFWRNPNKIKYLCAGSLINRWYVLTAKHCLIDDLADAIALVTLGDHYTNREKDCQDNICAPPAQDIVIEYARLFQDLEDKPDITVGDIGLIKLAQPAIFNDFVQPICLPRGNVISRHNEFAAIGTYFEVAGWGVKDAMNRSSSKLLYVSIPVVHRAVCQKIYADLRIDISQICVGQGGGKDSCIGDSGGPLMGHVALDASPKQYLFGVVSYGLTNCGSGPAVYTNVAYYMNWILSHIERLDL